MGGLSTGRVDSHPAQTGLERVTLKHRHHQVVIERIEFVAIVGGPPVDHDH